MSQKKIILIGNQNLVIQKHLKADDGKTPAQDLISQISAEAGVEEWVAEKFVSAWRWNHRDVQDTDETKLERKEEHFYLKQPLPVKREAGPENGTGKVAQIIALAEEGKSVAEIIALGYNKSTVYRQVSEWRKREKEKAAAVK